MTLLKSVYERFFVIFLQPERVAESRKKVLAAGKMIISFFLRK